MVVHVHKVHSRRNADVHDHTQESDANLFHRPTVSQSLLWSIIHPSKKNLSKNVTGLMDIKSINIEELEH